MIQFQCTAGATSIILPLAAYDSSSTIGALLAGLTYNSSGLTGYYSRSGVTGAAVSISLVTATKGTYTSGGFVAIDGTNMPGNYELHIPNAALATGAKSVLIQLKGATNMVPINILVELTAVDLQDNVRGGMTALPNANAAASGGLHILGTNATAVSYSAGITANITGNLSGSVGSVTGSVASVTGNVGGSVASVTGAVGSVTGNVGGSVASVTAAVTVSGTVAANMTQILGTAVSTPATAGILDVNLKNIANSAVNTGTAQLGVNVVSQANIDFGATQKASITTACTASTPTVSTVTSVTNPVTVSGDFSATMKTSLNASTPASIQNISAQTGDAYARIGAAGAGLTALGDTRIANLDAAVSSRSTFAGGAVASVTGGVGGNITGSVASVVGNVGGNVVGSVASVTNPVSVTGDLTSTMKTSVTTACTASTPTVSVNTSAIASAVAAAISVPTVGQIDSQLTSSHGAGTWGASAGGTGSKAVAITIDIGGNPLANVSVWVTTDQAGNSISAGTLLTNAFGVVSFMLNPGTYYIWKQLSGYNFTNPETITVT